MHPDIVPVDVVINLICAVARKTAVEHAESGKFDHSVAITYSVTMVVRHYVLLTVFLKFLNLAQLLCHFCPIITSPS